MPSCTNCGSLVPDGTAACSECGSLTATIMASTPLLAAQVAGNTSGTGKAAVIPPEIRGWNWGALFLNWVWGIRNSTYIALLCLIPYVNAVMPFVLGAKGTEWSWRNHKWDSVEQFKESQRRWAIWGLVLFVIFFTVMMIALGGVIYLFLSPYL